MSNAIPHEASGMEDLENFRLETLKKNKKLNRISVIIAALIIVSIVIFAIATGATEPALLIFMTVFLVIIPTAVIFYLKTRNIKAYRTMFRSLVVKQMWQQVDPEIKFEPDKYISQLHFSASKIFNVTPNTYKGENYISKSYDKFLFRASELDVTRRSGGKNKSSTPVFNGVFIVFELPTQFNGSTLIVRDMSNGVFGFLGGMLQDLGRYKYSSMEFNNPEFEKYFEIYSNNKEETMKLVEHDVVIQLLATRLNHGHVQMSFVDKYICIAIEDKSTFFMADPKVSLTDEVSLKRYIQELKKYESYYSRFLPVVERIANRSNDIRI